MQMDISDDPTPTSLASSMRITKRKLDDAFQVLDSVVTPSPMDSPSQPPLKRVNTNRSLYSTLAKYGVKTKDDNPTNRNSSSNILRNLSKSAPHLTAILNRAATRTKSALPFKFAAPTTTASPLLSDSADYRPSSLPSFLSRLATFKLATYANKPPSIDAVAAAKCGWTNDGKDRLVCGFCHASWVVAGREGLNRDAANALVEKQQMSLVESHKSGCPWRTRQCDSSIYCISLQSPGNMIKDLRMNASLLDLMVQDVVIKHPLAETQRISLCSTISLYAQEVGDASTANLSSNAVLIALFGWTLVPLTASPSIRRVSTTRSSSRAPSAPTTPSISRASSVAPTPFKDGQSSESAMFRLPSAIPTRKDNTMLECKLCQRRIGLWTFFSQNAPAPEPHGSTDSPEPSTLVRSQKRKDIQQRPFDLLKEHRSYCPYVVRSTTVPSLPIPRPMNITPLTSGTAQLHSSSQMDLRNGTDGTLEGWRAVLTIILRHGIAQRQSLNHDVFFVGDQADKGNEVEEEELDGVKAMVAGVKKHGGKDLLFYVKNLLG